MLATLAAGFTALCWSRRPRHAPFEKVGVPMTCLVAVTDHALVVPIGRRAPLGLPCQVHDAELWFAESPADLERTKALCAECPVGLACLAGAMRRREPAGVWGGQIFQDGVVLPFKRSRGRPRKHSAVGCRSTAHASNEARATPT
jgi:WhiB family redox-sensing transcriptional regulator